MQGRRSNFFQHIAQGRRGGAPVVVVLAVDHHDADYPFGGLGVVGGTNGGRKDQRQPTKGDEGEAMLHSHADTDKAPLSIGSLAPVCSFLRFPFQLLVYRLMRANFCIAARSTNLVCCHFDTLGVNDDKPMSTLNFCPDCVSYPPVLHQIKFALNWVPHKTN